ncbi:MAG: hypothetical protein IPF47_13195 [Gemmatimonadetes bacterium]|nr:hypothetical protein [Gemmatimonadota bacterium]
MILAIACPHCGRRPVLTARNVKYARSFLWGDPLYSEMYLAGCRWCVRWRVQRTVLRNVFEVPVSILTRTLGLLNLFAIVPQNLFAVVWRGSQEHQLKCLSIWLYDEGKEVDDVVIGEDGLTGSDRALVLRLAYLLRNAAAADGEISAEELRRAVAAIGSFHGRALHARAGPRAPDRGGRRGTTACRLRLRAAHRAASRGARRPGGG